MSLPGVPGTINAITLEETNRELANYLAKPGSDIPFRLVCNFVTLNRVIRLVPLYPPRIADHLRLAIQPKGPPPRWASRLKAQSGRRLAPVPGWVSSNGS